MKKFIIILVFIIVLFGTVSVAAQRQPVDAKEIIARCAEAMGGVDRIENIKTCRFDVSYPGHEYTVTTDIKRPNLMRNAGGRGIGVFDGKNARLLHKDPATGRFTKNVPIKKEFLADFYAEPGFFFFYFFDFPAEYLETVEIDGKKTYQLQVRMPLDVQIHYFIDADTYLPVRTTAHLTVGGKKVVWARDYLDYKLVEGIKYPHGFLYYWKETDKKKATVNRVEWNVQFPDHHFEVQE